MTDYKTIEGLDADDLAEAFAWLDELRASASQNMFGARPDLVAEFNDLIDDGPRRERGIKVLRAWMITFGEGTPDERALKALEMNW